MDRLTQLAFRIEHELPRSHHAFAFGQPAQDLVEVAFRAQPERHRARLKLPAIQHDENGVLFTAAQDGRVRHQQCGRRQFGGELHGSEHAGLQKIARVVEFHPHLSRARLIIHGWVDIGDTPAELAVRQIGKTHGGFLTEPDKREVLLVNLRLHPDCSQVSQPVELHSGIDHLAIHHHLLDDDAIARGIDAERLSRLAVLLDLGDLLVGNVEKLEFGQCAGLEWLGSDPGQVGGLTERQQVLDLGAVKLRRINLEKRLAAMHLLAG